MSLERKRVLSGKFIHKNAEKIERKKEAKQMRRCQLVSKRKAVFDGLNIKRTAKERVRDHIAFGCSVVFG